VLVDRLIQEARHAGYRQMRLDTLPSMATALALYRRLGFREIAPYYKNPVEGAVFLELPLDGPAR
jgi:ribosomal protein S18 acetylase RimI-like enzyme